LFLLLAEQSKLPAGLKRSAVGGSSCVRRMRRRGFTASKRNKVSVCENHVTAGETAN
jgi:hypothetical protein